MNGAANTPTFGLRRPLTNQLHICCAIADEDVFNENLGRSPCLLTNGGTVPLATRRGWSNVPAAYNDMMESTDAMYRAFIHEDVYLPIEFPEALLRGVKVVERRNLWWDVIGAAGTVWVDQPGGTVKMYAGNYKDRDDPSPNEVELPCQVETVDEMVIVTKSGRKFDEENPFHHLMAADMCWRGRAVYVVDAWCHHNCKGKWKRLPMEFAVSAGYMYRKHHDRLPLSTNCATIQKVNGVCSIVA